MLMRRLLPLLFLLLLGIVGLDSLGRQRQRARAQQAQAERSQQMERVASESQRRLTQRLEQLRERLSVVTGSGSSEGSRSGEEARLVWRRAWRDEPLLRQVFWLGPAGVPNWPPRGGQEASGVAFWQRTAHLWPLRLPQHEAAFGSGNQADTRAQWFAWVHDDLPALLLVWSDSAGGRAERGVELNQAALLEELNHALAQVALGPDQQLVLLGPSGTTLLRQGAVFGPVGEDEAGAKFVSQPKSKGGMDMRQRLDWPLASLQVEVAMAALPPSKSQGERWLPLLVGGPLWLSLLGWIWWTGELPLRRAQRHADLLAQAGHQCATPLQGIALQAELAQRGLGAGGEAEVKRRLLRIEEEAARLGGRLRDLQASARARAVALWPVELNLEEELEAIVQRWQAQLAAQGVELRYSGLVSGDQVDAEAVADSAAVDREAPVRARVDAAALAHVLDNLIENARVHGKPPGGEAARIELRLRPADADAAGKLWLEVHDNGAGIPAAQRRRVLRPWVRLQPKAGLTSTAGSGLGLAVVQRLVRAAGWRMSLDQSDLGGLRVRLELDGGRKATEGGVEWQQGRDEAKSNPTT